MRIIGLAGPAGAGKSTIAKVIAERLAADVVSFASPIKEMLRVGLCLSDAELYGDLKEEVNPVYGVTNRHLMQTLGTEWGRNLITPDIWERALLHRHQGPYTVVVDDVRFSNEAELVRKYGTVVHVTGRSLALGTSHASEVGVTPKPQDFMFDNKGALNRVEVFNMADAIFKGLK